MTPSFFIRLCDGKIILWDYILHSQYELDIKHFRRILELTKGAQLKDDPIDTTIKQSRILEHTEGDEWGWDILSRIFHKGTQIRLDSSVEIPIHDSYAGYIEYCKSILDSVPDFFPKREGKTIQLPPPDLSTIRNANLIETLLDRATTRNFNAEPLTLEQMSAAMWTCFGAIHGKTRNDLETLGMMPIGLRKTSPSGGSIHPSEAYIVALRVIGLEKGIYHYRPDEHAITKISEFEDKDKLGSLLANQHFANDVAYGVFITSRFDKMWWKYKHSRAYRVALLDIGCLIQTFQLVNTAMGVASWPTGYFIDSEINKLLDVNEERESVMFFLGAGRGSGPIAAELLSK